MELKLPLRNSQPWVFRPCVLLLPYWHSGRWWLVQKMRSKTDIVKRAAGLKDLHHYCIREAGVYLSHKRHIVSWGTVD